MCACGNDLGHLFKDKKYKTEHKSTTNILLTIAARYKKLQAGVLYICSFEIYFAIY